jgi:23S rRNA (pseudouridine1915-N3)-methyltransferase
MRVWIYYIGKMRDQHANAIAQEYVKRISRYATVEMREIDPDRFDLFGRHPSARKVFLDPAGRALSTAEFVDIFQKGETVGQELLFLVGGHDGLPPQWRPKADLLLSLSGMTFPHELARAMLTEQIYRAFTTLRGHPYPR